MPISPNRWEVITPSKFEWEQEALDFIRQRGPDTILHAWSNFEFTTSQGAIYEVDLLLLTTGGLYLIEIKSRPGRIEGDATNWMWGGRIYDNPIILANRKAKALKELIARQLDKSRQITVPWVSELVFLSNPGTQPHLPADVMFKVYQREQLIAALLPGGPLIARERHPVDRRSEAALVKAIKDAGVRASRKALQAGDYMLEKLIDEGPGYQDFIAHHVSLKQVVRRVRQFSVARAPSPGEREMALRAARRDFTLLEGVQHPGILRPVDYTTNDYGAALIFEYDETAQRLDKWLTQHKDADSKTRTAIWRQIADALRYAHSRRIVHRALSPLSVLVYPNGQVKLMNWHTGARQEGTTGTVHVEELVESKAAVYLAPESLKAPDQATPAADVFSLGCIGFFLFSGRPPAPDFLQLQALLRQHQALSLAGVVNGADPDIDNLIEFCTHPNPLERIPLEEFFEYLPDIEEKFAPKVEVDPLKATRNTRLPFDLTVNKPLGSGSISQVLLVNRGEDEFVLKVAVRPDDNRRLREEAEVLKIVRDRHIIELVETHEMAGHECLLLRPATRETLQEKLDEEGRLSLDMLERFGDDLLHVLEVLEAAGIAHRDIKPANLGVTRLGKDERRHLVLFDFSLAKEPPDNITAGTRGYLDPFLSLRRPPRWDSHAERFSAAVTLYQMATGVLPRWGDGHTEPELTDTEVEIEAEYLDSTVRDTLSNFFTRALGRDPKSRFDNATHMHDAWLEAFESARQAIRTGFTGSNLTPEQLIEAAQLDTSVFSLGLSQSAEQALDRLQVLTVEQFMALPVRELRILRGVGNRTCKELLQRREQLVNRFPHGPAVHRSQAQALDALVPRLTPKSVPSWTPHLLGLVSNLSLWPDALEVALASGISEGVVRASLDPLRQEWRKEPALTLVRNNIDTLLLRLGGVLPIADLVDAVRAAQGALSEDSETVRRMAVAVTRAAVEAEQIEATPRYLPVRAPSTMVITRSAELADYALELGRAADRLADEYPLAPPHRVLEVLRTVSAPDEAALSNPKLLGLAAAASRHAAVSSRQEIYPRGMSAARALALSRGALLEAELAPDVMASRIQNRYPESEPLPDRPHLDALLAADGWDIRWSDERQAFVRQDAEPSSTYTSLRRRSTAGGRRRTDDPSEAAAWDCEEKLAAAKKRGGFLSLLAVPEGLQEAEYQIVRQFSPVVFSIDALFIETMRSVAGEFGASWQTVVAADRRRDTEDFGRLKSLVMTASQRIEARLLQQNGDHLLLTHAGLVARYGRMDLIEHLRDAAGRREGPASIWVLLVADERQDSPFIDDMAVPLISPSQKLRLPLAWITNQHRGAVATP